MKNLTKITPDAGSVNIIEEPQVGSLVNSGLLTCEPRMTLQQVAKRMHMAKVSCILVVEDEKLLGIWTEGDTRKLDFAEPSLLATPISELMSAPVISIPYATKLSEAAAYMKEKGLRRLLVLSKKNEPLGVLTQSDLVRHQGVENYLLMRDVGSSVRTEPVFLDASLNLAAAVKKLREARAEAAVVLRESKKPSIVTERDLIRALALDKRELTLADLSQNELFCVTKDTSLLHAIELLREKNYRHLGVYGLDAQGQSNNQVEGLLSFSDILSSIEFEYVSQLRDALEARDSALKASTEHLLLAQKVIEASLDGIIITNKQGVIQAVNPSFTTLTGYSEEEALGRTPAMLSSGKHGKDFYQAMWQSMLRQGYWQGEIFNKRKNGEVYVEWLTVTAIRNNKGEIRQFAAIFSDITDRKQKEQQIHSLAFYDELTGLANRRLIIERMKNALGYAHYNRHKMGVLFLDLDLFKRINDSLGHQAGDEVLEKIARRLELGVRDGDSVARLGGDEFVILVPQIEGIYELESLAARLTNILTQPLTIQKNQLVVSTSIGISVYPDDGDNVDSLLKNADTAMYRAKEAGRNNFCFYNYQMGERSSADLALESGIRIALKEHKFYLVYQPKIDVASKEWVGMEALLRWEDDKLGRVSPAEFIPLAEKLGLIEDLGNWVVEKVCQQIRSWLDAGLVPPRVSLNVSARQLLNKNFASQVLEHLHTYQIPAALIELELTESCLVLGEEDSQSKLLKEFEKNGVRMSIDDFGTGYSSLAYLRHLPISTIKIDASFIAELPANKEDAQLVKAIISMASALGMELVAEGVETQEQAVLLQALGCSVHQGFWLAGPAAPEQITAWLHLSENKIWPSFPESW